MVNVMIEVKCKANLLEIVLALLRSILQNKDIRLLGQRNKRVSELTHLVFSGDGNQCSLGFGW